jgi:Putative GTPase activating protein for Arf
MICYAMQFSTIFISYICLSRTLDYRSMGVHISKVRSLTLDDLDVEEYKLLMRLGECQPLNC